MSESGGIGFLGLLTILFIALKFTGYITWSWIWVLSPIWLPIAIIVGLIIIWIIGMIVMGFVDKIKYYRND